MFELISCNSDCGFLFCRFGGQNTVSSFLDSIKPTDLLCLPGSSYRPGHICRFPGD